jgi:hypothetical protein
MRFLTTSSDLFPRRWSGGVVLAIMLAALITAGCSQKPAASQEASNEKSSEAGPSKAKGTGGNSAQESESSDAGSKSAKSTLEIGTARRDPGQVLSIPLEFTSAPHQSVGTIQAELHVKEGPWKFQKAKLAEGSRGTISAKPGKAAGGDGFVIKLEISTGNREIGDGVAGYVTFSVNDSSTSQIPITVGRLDTFPPGVEPGDTPQTSAGGELPPAPDSDKPTPGCFFFTH